MTTDHCLQYICQAAFPFMEGQHRHGIDIHTYILPHIFAPWPLMKEESHPYYITNWIELKHG